MRASVSSFFVVLAASTLVACGSEDEGPYGKEVKDPLTLVSSLPAAGATNFDPSRTIELEFSRAVDPASLAVVLVGATDAVVKAEKEVVEVTATLEFDTDYVLRIDHAEDTFGNALAGTPVSIAFRTAEDGTPTKSTIADVQPIFTRSCIDGCHNDGRNPSGGLSLVAGRSYAQLVDVRGGTCSPGVRTRVTPGDPDASCLWVLVERNEMPGRGSISTADKEAIRKWIADGALP